MCKILWVKISHVIVFLLFFACRLTDVVHVVFTRHIDYLVDPRFGAHRYGFEQSFQSRCALDRALFQITRPALPERWMTHQSASVVEDQGFVKLGRYTVILNNLNEDKII